MKGIILAGGAGTRLYPLTMVTSKQLLPEARRPVRPASAVQGPAEPRRPGPGVYPGRGVHWRRLLRHGPGRQHLLRRRLLQASEKCRRQRCQWPQGRITVFGYYVNDPERFGVVAFDKDGHATDIEEKPANPKSNYAVTGLYFYNSDVVKMAKQVKPSARGELEITTLNQMYLDHALRDTGTMDSLVEAATFVQTVEQRQGIKISAPEEIAYKYGWITKEKLLESAARYGKSPYGQHLKNVADDKLQY